jgi:hypothetical protein
MRRIVTVVTGAVVVTGILAAGIAVAGLASTSSPLATGQTTSEETTEKPVTTRFRAALTARAEVPTPEGVNPGAAGTFLVPLTDDHGSFSIAWTLTLRNLTGRATAAHIHRGRPGKAGPVIVSLCGPCRSGRKGKTKVSKAVASTVKAGAAYVNVHTAQNPAGEIRGQIRRAR